MYDGEGDVEILDPRVLKKQPLGGRYCKRMIKKPRWQEMLTLLKFS